MTEKAPQKVSEQSARYLSAKDKLTVDPFLALRAIAKTAIGDDLKEALLEEGHEDIVAEVFPELPPPIIPRGKSR
jgi:hypothetical protein